MNNTLPKLNKHHKRTARLKPKWSAIFKNPGEKIEPKPYGCELCDRRFARAVNLGSHVAQAHKFHETSSMDFSKPSARQGFELPRELQNYQPSIYDEQAPVMSTKVQRKLAAQKKRRRVDKSKWQTIIDSYDTAPSKEEWINDKTKNTEGITRRDISRWKGIFQKEAKEDEEESWFFQKKHLFKG